MKKTTVGMVMFALGAASGAVVGILKAPHKGTITRAKLKAKLDEKKERGQEKMYGIKSKVKELGSSNQEAHNGPY